MGQPRQTSPIRFKIESLGSYGAYDHCKQGTSPACCDLECLELDPDLADYQTVECMALDLVDRGRYDTSDIGRIPGVHIPHSGAFACRTSG